MAPVEGAVQAIPIGAVAPVVDGLLGTDGLRHSVKDAPNAFATDWPVSTTYVNVNPPSAARSTIRA